MVNWKAAFEALFKNENEENFYKQLNEIINNVILDKISFLEIANKKANEKIEGNEEKINDAEKDISTLISISNQHMEEVKTDYIKKDVFLKIIKNMTCQINNRDTEINHLKDNIETLKANNKLLNEKIDLIYEKISDGKN